MNLDWIGASYSVFTHLYWWRDLQVLGVVYERCVLKAGQLKTGCSKTGGDCIVYCIVYCILYCTHYWWSVSFNFFPSSKILARQNDVIIQDGASSRCHIYTNTGCST